jgi:hypothetical protein
LIFTFSNLLVGVECGARLPARYAATRSARLGAKLGYPSGEAKRVANKQNGELERRFYRLFDLLSMPIFVTGIGPVLQ